MPPPETTPESPPTVGEPAAADPPPGRVRRLFRAYLTPAGKQALRNLVGLVACTAVSQACSLAVLLLLTNALSPAAFGAVVFALNVQGYLITLGMFGLASVVVRDLTQSPDHAAAVTAAYLRIVAVASVVAGGLTAVGVAVAPLSADERVMLWCLAAGNLAACLNLNPLFDAAHRQALAAALVVPVDVLGLGVVAGLAWAGGLSVPAVGFVLLGKLVLTAGLHLTVFHRAVRPLRRVGDEGRGRRMRAAGWPLLVAGLLHMIPISGSVVLVRMLAGEEATAIYGLAFQILSIQIMLLVLLTRVLQPHITGPHGVARRFLVQLALVVAATALALAATGLVGGWVLFYHILRPDYRPAFEVLAVLQAYVVLALVAGVVFGYLLRFHGERWVRASYVVAVPTYLAIVLLGGYRFRLGFAVATGASAGVLVAVGLVGLWVTARGTAEPGVADPGEATPGNPTLQERE